MKNEVAEDGFQLVTRKHRTRSHKQQAVQQVPRSSVVNSEQVSNVPRQIVVGLVERAWKELEDSKFFTVTVRALDKSLRLCGHQTVRHILCYGLGNFSECIAARYQLALLLALKAKFSASVSLFDPKFSATERTVLPEDFDCELLSVNEEGRQPLKPDLCTLVFAPHCPRQLTNNWLWANWGTELGDAIFLGNSFLSVAFNPSCQVNSAQYLLRICPFVTEQPLPNIFRFGDVFNDLAFHTFATSSAPKALWSLRSCTPPEYPADDTGALIRDDNAEHGRTDPARFAERAEENSRATNLE